MAKTPNVLTLVEGIQLHDWMKENWEKKVKANKWTQEQTARRVSSELGFHVTEGNIRKLLDTMFPQFNYMHAAPNSTNPIHSLKAKADRIEIVEKKMEELENKIKKAEYSTNAMASIHARRLASGAGFSSGSACPAI